MASTRYNWLFLEPFVYYGVLALDSYGLTTDKQTVMLYVAFTAWVTVKYLLFMWAIVEQITCFLGIRFLVNKPAVS